MKSYFLAMVCTGAGLSVLSLVYLALLPLLRRRYGPRGLYRVWVVVLAGLLIPFSLLASRPLMTVELPRALSRPVGGGAATAAPLTAESQTADAVQAPSAVQASAAAQTAQQPVRTDADAQHAYVENTTGTTTADRMLTAVEGEQSASASAIIPVGWLSVLAWVWLAGVAAVLALALLFLVQPVEWYHCFRALADPGFAPPDLGVGAMYGEVAAYTKAGDFWQFVAGNVTLGQKASLLWAVNAGRYSQTAGLFLLGLLLGRRGLFSDSADNARFWVRTLIVGAVAFVPLQALHGLFGEATAARMAATVLDMWQKLAFTAVLAASFVLLYRTARFRRVTDGLRFYGRMSLTNYIAQSVVGALIFFPFGLGLASRCGYALSLVIGVAVFVLQAAFCRWWLRGHRQGPLESLWHRLTWLGAK